MTQRKRSGATPGGNTQDEENPLRRLTSLVLTPAQTATLFTTGKDVSATITLVEAKWTGTGWRVTFEVS